MALADASASSKAFSQVRVLHLQWNRIGDAGLEALAEACVRGGLRRCRILTLNGNKQITGAGLAALLDALQRGALEKLKQIDLTGNKVGAHLTLDGTLNELPCPRHHWRPVLRSIYSRARVACTRTADR